MKVRDSPSVTLVGLQYSGTAWVPRTRSSAGFVERSAARGESCSRRRVHPVPYNEDVCIPQVERQAREAGSRKELGLVPNERAQKLRSQLARGGAREGELRDGDARRVGERLGKGSHGPASRSEYRAGGSGRTDL